MEIDHYLQDSKNCKKTEEEAETIVMRTQRKHMENTKIWLLLISVNYTAGGLEFLYRKTKIIYEPNKFKNERQNLPSRRKRQASKWENIRGLTSLHFPFW